LGHRAAEEVTNEPLLTPEELLAIDTAGKLATLCGSIIQGPNRANDLREIIGHVHAIQQAVMSQAAGRAYPDKFRLLGRTFEE